MRFYCGPILVLLLVFLAGCGPEPEINRLAEQSPFRSEGSRGEGVETLLVSCGYYPMELPGDVDLGGQAFGLAGPNDVALDGTGFAKDDIQNWRLNGMEIMVLPADLWPGLYQKLLDAGGRNVSQSVTYFRNVDELAIFEMVYQPEGSSVFRADKGRVKGQSLTAGRTVLRVSCVPVSEEKEIRFFMVPAFEGDVSQGGYRRDEGGHLRYYNEKPQTIFDSLLVRGRLRVGQFVVIRALPKDQAVGNLGEVLLRGQAESGAVQRVAVLIPKMETIVKY